MRSLCNVFYVQPGKNKFGDSWVNPLMKLSMFVVLCPFTLRCNLCVKSETLCFIYRETDMMMDVFVDRVGVNLDWPEPFVALAPNSIYHVGVLKSDICQIVFSAQWSDACDMLVEKNEWKHNKQINKQKKNIQIWDVRLGQLSPKRFQHVVESIENNIIFDIRYLFCLTSSSTLQFMTKQ